MISTNGTGAPQGLDTLVVDPTGSDVRVDEPGSNLLDSLVKDPAGRPPLADAEGFAAILRGMVADYAPRLFAIVQEYGERVDARIVAWGMAFEDRAFAVSDDGSTRHESESPEDILFGFGFGTHIQPRLVWVDPSAATPDEDIEDPAED
jgi:hypothetical protein